MNTAKREITIIVLAIFSLILFSVFGISKIIDSGPTQKEELEMTIQDSLSSEINILKIENDRYEIILNRLYERDSIMYNEITSNLE